jgi:hypothetical protein
MPRIIHRLPSDPTMQDPSLIEGSKYFDKPTNVVEETRVVIKSPRPPSRPPSRTLTVVSARERRSANRHHVSESEDSDYGTQEDHRRRYRHDAYARGRSRNSRRGTRLRRSRHRGMDDEGESFRGSIRHDCLRSRANFSVDLFEAPPHRYIQAPSPPPSGPFRPSEPDIIRTTEYETLDHHSRPTTPTRRRRSRSRDRHEPRAGPPVLRSGDEVIEIQPHKPMPTEEYDWYDRNGMRVRVREI